MDSLDVPEGAKPNYHSQGGEKERPPNYIPSGYISFGCIRRGVYIIGHFFFQTQEGPPKSTC